MIDGAKIVRTRAAIDSVDEFLLRVREELEADKREEYIDELLEAANQEILFIRVNLLGTLKFDTMGGNNNGNES